MRPSRLFAEICDILHMLMQALSLHIFLYFAESKKIPLFLVIFFVAGRSRPFPFRHAFIPRRNML